MGAPLVSVVMATFNESVSYITSSIESILNQTYSNLELLIADDSTNLDAKNVIDSFASKDKRVIVIRQKERMGFVIALNEGLRQAKGKYIARMDGDDIALPNRLQLQVDYLETHPEVDILGGCMNIINEHGELVSLRNYPLGGVRLLAWATIRNPFAHPTVMLRASIPQNGHYYDVTQKKAEDIEYWLRLKHLGYNWQNLSDKLINYRVEGDLALKRNREQWKFNYKARLKNFSWKSPLFSLISISVSFLYVRAPKGIVKMMYHKENSKLQTVHN